MTTGNTTRSVNDYIPNFETIEIRNSSTVSTLATFLSDDGLSALHDLAERLERSLPEAIDAGVRFLVSSVVTNEHSEVKDWLLHGPSCSMQEVSEAACQAKTDAGDRADGVLDADGNYRC